MYFFEKDRRSPRETFPVSFDRMWRYFDPRPLIVHRDNRAKFNEWLREFPPGLPDFYATAFAQLHYRSHGALKAVVVEALEYCRSMIEERGYERTDIRNLTIARPESSHVMLVAGCQGPKVRKARVLAAYHVFRRIPDHIQVKIVFSGRNPAERPARIHVLTQRLGNFITIRKEETCGQK